MIKFNNFAIIGVYVMWSFIKEFLVHVLLVLFPVFFYYMFVRGSHRGPQPIFHWKSFLTLAGAVLLTMSFSISYADTFTFDLRIVPIIVAFLYTGSLPGILLVAVMLAYTKLIQPAEFLAMMGNYAIASIILLLIRPLYGKLTWNKKIAMISLFYLSITITREIYFLQKGQLELFLNTIFLSIITWVTLIMVVMIIEHMENHLKMKREYEYLEKINAISQLAASIAHEIRNPMTTVRGFLQLLSTNSELSSKNKSFIHLSIEELDRAQSIISDFLALSKPQKENLEVIDLTKIIHDSIHIITPYALLKNIRIDAAIESNLVSNGFKHEIQQVLINILKNGIEAMDRGTLVVHASRTNSSIAISIKDTGCGIPSDQLKRLGTPYYSTKEKGTGLGLTVSFEIVRRMNGAIHVESTVNQGTVFTISLPATKA